MKNLEKIYQFINEQCQFFDGAVVGLSGGLDSAVVLALLHKAGINAHALIMPSKNSSEKNLRDALSLAKQFATKHSIIDIEPILQSFLPHTDSKNMLLVGNLCARIRMTLLYDYSAQHRLLVAGTSNKSERLLGYGTIFGDMACAFNVLGEFYKSEVFELAKILEIPDEIICKKPSADFYEGQSDEADLGFSYAEIDEFLKLFEKGEKFEQKYENLAARIRKNAFKREGVKIYHR